MDKKDKVSPAKYNQSLVRKDIIFVALTLLVTTIFHKGLAYYGDIVLTETVGKFINPKDILCIIGFGIFLLSSIAASIIHSRIVKKSFPSWVTYSSFLVAWLCIFFWIVPNPFWQFYTIDFNEFSVPYVLPVIILCLYISYSRIEAYKITSPLEPHNTSIFSIEQLPFDNPEEIVQDSFGRSPKAEFIAGEILKIKLSRSVGFGIVGRWGSGKTYFVKLVLQSLLNRAAQSGLPKPKILYFIPWAHQLEELESQFLKQFEGELDGRLASEFKSYANQFYQKSKKWFEKNPLELIAPSEPIDISQLNTALADGNNRYVVIIDDLDRLNNKEVIEVLRIIRNTANFANTFYLIGYDRAYIENSIKLINSENPTEYLNKIFQVQFHLPHPTRSALVELFTKRCQDALLNYFQKVEATGYQSAKRSLDTCVQRINSHEDLLGHLQLIGSFNSQGQTEFKKDVPHDHFANFVTNPRDVTILVNSFMQCFLEDQKYSMIDSYELFQVELIKLKAPRIYELLRAKSFLHSIPNEAISVNEDFLEMYFPGTGSANDKIRESKYIVKALFERRSSDNSAFAIRNRDYFEWYFDSFTAILSPTDRITSETIEDAGLNDLIKVLITQKTSSFKNYVSEMVRTPSAQNLVRKGKIVIYSSLLDEDLLMAGTVETFFERNEKLLHDAQSEELIKFIQNSLVEKPVEVAVVCSQLLANHYYKTGKLSQIVKPAVLKPVVVQCLDQAVIQELKYSEVISIYTNCIEEIIDSHVKFMSDAKKKIIPYLVKQPSDFMENIIIPEVIGEPDSRYVPNAIALSIFDDSPEQLSQYVKGLKRTAKTIEVTYFLKLFSKQNRSIHWIPGSIVEVSDSSTLVNKYESVSPYQNSVTFTHSGFSEIVARDVWFKKMKTNFIAHLEVIPKEEAITGGTYSFIKKIELEDSTLIEQATLKLWVDDTCKLSINGIPVLTSEITTHAPVPITFDSGALVTGPNELVFTVRNFSLKELGWDDADGHSNPYALLYELDIKLINQDSAQTK